MKNKDEDRCASSFRMQYANLQSNLFVKQVLLEVCCCSGYISSINHATSHLRSSLHSAKAGNFELDGLSVNDVRAATMSRLTGLPTENVSKDKYYNNQLIGLYHTQEKCKCVLHINFFL